jgi:hypothetical protein
MSHQARDVGRKAMCVGRGQRSVDSSMRKNRGDVRVGVGSSMRSTSSVECCRGNVGVGVVSSSGSTSSVGGSRCQCRELLYKCGGSCGMEVGSRGSCSQEMISRGSCCLEVGSWGYGS